MIGRQLAIILISATLVGCSTSNTLQPQQPALDDANIKLAEAASSVSSSLIELARIESTTAPVNTKNLPSADIPGMSELASVDWSGPIGPLVEKLAAASGYRLRVLGKAPAIPVLVSITAVNVPLSSILRDIDFQASKKAHIVVYPNPNPSKRVIELRYAVT